jgi:glycosyltransferase involved in cell wall biosynthesis
VVIPHKNQIEFLVRSLQSVIQQTFKANTIIIVDDHSDNFEKVLSEIEFCLDNETEIKVILNQGFGVSAARNTGIRESTATHIAFLDADDYWLPHN